MAERKRKYESGRTSPAHKLEVAIEMLNKLYSALGDGPYARSHVLEALGHNPKSGPGQVKVGTLTHFGLLDRTGGKYSISKIARDILLPGDEQERRTAIAAASRKPSLYAELFSDFEGRALPDLFANILTQRYSVQPKRRQEVADRFTASAEYAGLLRNGVLYSEPCTDTSPQCGDRSQPRPQGNDDPAARPHPERTSLARSTTDTREYTVPLDLSGRQAVLRLPIPVTANDLASVKQWVSFMQETLAHEKPDAGTVS